MHSNKKKPRAKHPAKVRAVSKRMAKEQRDADKRAVRDARLKKDPAA